MHAYFWSNRHFFITFRHRTDIFVTNQGTRHVIKDGWTKFPRIIYTPVVYLSVIPLVQNTVYVEDQENATVKWGGKTGD